MLEIPKAQDPVDPPEFQDKSNCDTELQTIPKPSRSKLIITPIPHNSNKSTSGETISWDDIKISHEPSEELKGDILPTTSFSTKRKLNQCSESQLNDGKKMKFNRKKIHCKICGDIFETLDEKIEHIKNTHVSRLSHPVSGRSINNRKREINSPLVITL